MLTHSEKLLTELETRLKTISSETQGVLSQAEQSGVACDQTIAKLKELVLKLKFKSEDEEIFFFKNIKPQFTSKLFYYILLYNLERRRLFKTDSSQIEYLESCQAGLENYFQENLEFCNYYRSKSTILDDKYFVRNKLNMHLAYTDAFFSYDKGFSTNRDSHVAHIQASDLLSEYIATEIEKVRNRKAISRHDNISNLLWTDTKVSLTHLVYALHSSAVFNSGNVELKEIAQTFSKVCNIDLGDIYRTWSEIKLKKYPTKFLEGLKLALDNRIKADFS